MNVNGRGTHSIMKKQSLRPLLTAAALVCIACFGSALAGTVQLGVTDKDGKPAPDVVVMVDAAAKAPTPSTFVIEQQDLRFVPYLTVVPVGSTLRFVNRDTYDHHVRSMPTGPLGATPPVVSFELRLDPGQAAAASPNDEYKSSAPVRKRSGASSVDVKVDKPGAIGLGCHLHSSMRGHVYVSNSPWFGKTDANGMVSIDGVPDGAVELQLWHADQLQEQAPVRVTVGAVPVKSSAQLNFTPRRRRGS